MKYAFIQRHRQVWPISVQCRVLQVSVAGYHEHFVRRASDAQRRHLSDDALLVHIKAIHAQTLGGYGWPRTWKELLARGIRVGKERVRVLMQRHGISGLPVVEGESGRLAGILTNRDVRFVPRSDRPVRELMTAERLITVREGASRAEAMDLLHEHKIEKLLVVDEHYRLVGLITVKDIEKAQRFPNACKDSQGRLRVGAAVGLPWRSGRHELQLSCSMGVACFPSDGLTVEQLLRRFNKGVVAERITKTYREKMHFVSKSEQRKEKRRRAERNRRKKAMSQGH